MLELKEKDATLPQSALKVRKEAFVCMLIHDKAKMPEMKAHAIHVGIMPA